MKIDDFTAPVFNPMIGELKPRGYILSHLSSVHACLDRLGIGVPVAWLYGVTGYAFMLNIPKGVNCAGPTLWDWRSIKDRMPFLGADLSQFVYAQKSDKDFTAQKQKGITFTKEMFSEGVPLYGCEFGFPEFYTVQKADDTGFTYAWMGLLDMQAFTVERSWDEFGTLDVGVLFVSAVKRAAEKPDDMKAISAALSFAVAVGHAEAGFLDGADVGLRGYDRWITSLTDGSLKEGVWCHPHGTTHNAANWWECRSHAGEFLVQCAGKVGDDLGKRFLRAAEHYRDVAHALARVRAWFPWGMSDDLPSLELVEKTTKELKRARESESRGLALLDEVQRKI